MKFKITTDQRAQKLLMLYDINMTPNYLPKIVQEYPRLFGGEIQKILETHSAIAGKIPDILTGKMSASDSVMKEVDKIQLPVSGSLDEVVTAELQLFYSIEPKISQFLHNTFNVELPKEATLILLEKSGYENKSTGGCALCYKPILLGCYVERTGRDDVGLVNSILCMCLHELLHAVLPHKKLTESQHNSSDYEEALIRYFAPEGIFTEWLGLTKKKSIDEYFSANFREISNLREQATKLLPMIKEYYRSGLKDIWKYVPLSDDDNETLT